MEKQKNSKEVDFFIVYVLGKMIEEETQKCIYLDKHEQTLKQSMKKFH